MATETWKVIFRKYLRLGRSLLGVRIEIRTLYLETYESIFERKIFSNDLRARCQRNMSKEEQEALEDFEAI